MTIPLHIRIVEARNLKVADTNGFSDPFVQMKIKGLFHKSHKTRVIPKNVNPVWDEDFVLEPSHPDKDILVIRVYDKDTVSKNDFLGEVRLPVIQYMNRGTCDEWRALTTKAGGPARGDIHLVISYGTGALPSTVIPPSVMSNTTATLPPDVAAQHIVKPPMIGNPNPAMMGQPPSSVSTTSYTTSYPSNIPPH